MRGALCIACVAAASLWLAAGVSAAEPWAAAADVRAALSNAETELVIGSRAGARRAARGRRPRGRGRARGTRGVAAVCARGALARGRGGEPWRRERVRGGTRHAVGGRPAGGLPRGDGGRETRRPGHRALVAAHPRVPGSHPLLTRGGRRHARARPPRARGRHAGGGCRRGAQRPAGHVRGTAARVAGRRAVGAARRLRGPATRRGGGHGWLLVDRAGCIRGAARPRERAQDGRGAGAPEHGRARRARSGQGATRGRRPPGRVPGGAALAARSSCGGPVSSTASCVSCPSSTAAACATGVWCSTSRSRRRSRSATAPPERSETSSRRCCAATRPPRAGSPSR